jgi:hypothetical protein
MFNCVAVCAQNSAFGNLGKDGALRRPLIYHSTDVSFFVARMMVKLESRGMGETAARANQGFLECLEPQFGVSLPFALESSLFFWVAVWHWNLR